MERTAYRATGQLPKPFEDYNVVELQAFLLFGDEAMEELDVISQDEEDLDWLFQDKQKKPKRRMRRRLKPLKQPSSFGEAVSTGDPVVDEWEQAIARGEMPDL